MLTNINDSFKEAFSFNFCINTMLRRLKKKSSTKLINEQNM